MPHTNPTPSARPFDQYYTRPDTAQTCVALLHSVLPDLTADLYLEPSAGDSAFLDLLPEPRLGMDIAPAAPAIETRDFLKWKPDPTLERIVVVGNPPFGRNGAMAINFFNWAAQYADVIAMILPASLMKGSMQDRLDSRFHLISEMPLPNEGFRVENGLHRVNAVFQVWQCQPVPRPRTTFRTTHEDFRFVPTMTEADFALRRVGGRAGDILPLPAGSDAAHGYSPSSNLFIKSNGIDPEELRARFQTLDFSECRRRVTANPSVSKREIVALYETQMALEALVHAKAEQAHSEVEVG